MKYTESFKQEVLAYLKNHSRNATAKFFNVSSHAIHCWEDSQFANKAKKLTNEWQKQKYKDNPIYKKAHYKKIVKLNKKRREEDPILREKQNKENSKRIMEKYRSDPKFKQQHNERANTYIKNKLKSDQIYKSNYNKMMRKYDRKRRALKQNINENYTKEDEKYTMNLFNYQCAECNSKENLCIDHWKPLSKGYPLSKTNAVVLCRSCNSSKHDKMPKEHYSKEFVELVESILIKS